LAVHASSQTPVDLGLPRQPGTSWRRETGFETPVTLTTALRAAWTSIANEERSRRRTSLLKGGVRTFKRRSLKKKMRRNRE